MTFDPENPLAVEIQQETAAAYFAACKKMVTSLEALKAFDHAFPSSSRDNKQVTRRSTLLDDAVERVYFVIIQREAMKLPHYEEIFADFDIPDEVRRKMGPKELVR